jgi:translation initiation factor IF-3
MPTATALARAKELDLDLVEVAPQADPPVCRIMDFGKWKYEQDVRAKESRKKQSQVIVKEMKFRPKISDHDFSIKKGHVERFLDEGDKVKVTIMFRGREMAHTELGAKLLDRLARDLGEISQVEAAPKQDGRNMTMVLSPVKRVVKPAPKEPHQRGSGGERPAPSGAPPGVPSEVRSNVGPSGAPGSVPVTGSAPGEAAGNGAGEVEKAGA